jgi:rhodanese-related sulfurtransferase
MQELSARELHSWLTDQGREAPLLIDVREGWEVELGKIDGARHIPMTSIAAALPSLPLSAPIVVYCQHGIRSLKVVDFLVSQGGARVYNLHGGIAAWNQDVAVGGRR